MDQFTQKYVDGFMADLIARNPGEKEFHQAVNEVLVSVAPYIVEHPYLMDMKILERIVEPERIIIFRVPWLNDEGEVCVNRGYRVQCNSAIGPYKGGIRFLDPAADGAIVLHSNVAVSADAVLVGNVNSGKVLVDMNGKNVNHTAKTVALKNLELDTDAYTNYVFANNNATADADAFILDNCSVTGLVKPLWYVNVASNTLKNLTLVNTDIALAAATNIIDLAKTTSLGNESVIIKNCILYSLSNTVSRIINNSQNLTAWTADVVFEDNTIFNLHAGSNNGLIHMAGASSVIFKNNLASKAIKVLRNQLPPFRFFVITLTL